MSFYMKRKDIFALGVWIEKIDDTPQKMRTKNSFQKRKK